MASSRFSNVDEYGFERPEDFNAVEYESFMSTYLVVLARRAKKWANFLKGSKLQRNNRTFRRYIRKGIPFEHRAKIWMFTSGAIEAKERLGKDLYSKMLNEKPDPDLVDIIKTDMPRTFPENIYFNNTSENQERLFRILLAYGNHNKRVGYCQGMNYIAGILLLVTKSEDTSFWLLKMLVEEILPDYYSPTMSGLITDTEVFSSLIREKYPDVNERFNFIGLPWPVVVTKWFICLYCEVLPIETVLRVWDCLFNEGSKILIRVGLTLIARHRHKFISFEHFTELADYVKMCTKDSFALDCHLFMKSVFKASSKVTDKKLDLLRRSVVSNKNNDKDKKKT